MDPALTEEAVSSRGGGPRGPRHSDDGWMDGWHAMAAVACQQGTDYYSRVGEPLVEVQTDAVVLIPDQPVAGWWGRQAFRRGKRSHVNSAL